MRGKAVRFSKNHVHVYLYDRDAGEWVYRFCRLTGDMEHCAGSTPALPRGTRFDGEVTLTEDEELTA